MKLFKTLGLTVLLLGALTSCENEETLEEFENKEIENQLTQLPEVDPTNITSSANKAPVDISQLDGRWMLTHRYSNNQKKWYESNIAAYLFYQYTFFYSAYIWDIKDGEAEVILKFEHTGDERVARISKLRVGNNNEFYLGSLKYQAYSYRNGNALLLVPDYIDPTTNKQVVTQYYWWQRQ